MEAQAGLPNRLHALARVAAGRGAARRHPESGTCARDTSPRCGCPGSRASATRGSAGQPALRPSAGGRHPEVGAAPPGTGGHGANEMPPMCRQVLHKRGDAGTPGVARGARRRPGGREGGGLPHPPGEGTEVPVACPVRPAPPAPGGQPRRRRGGGAPSGPGGSRCSPTRIQPCGTGPPLGAGSPPPMAPAHAGALAAPVDPAAMRMRDS